jgi:hypothetical protein
MNSYIKFQGLRNFAVFLGNLFHDAMRKKLKLWIKFTKREVLRLQKITETGAVIAIQRIARGMMARHRVDHIREKNKFRTLYNATVKLQALFRCKITRWRYLRHQRNRLEDSCVRLLQRVTRGFRARKRVRILRRLKNREVAAVLVQTQIRIRQARNKVKAMMLDRLKKRVAVKIQALIRGFLARRSAAARKANILRFYAAQAIQARVRGMIARNHLSRRKQEAEAYWEGQRRAATNIQRMYRY